MRVLFVIIARGGSRGVPRKNLAEIGGIPLVGFKAISALRSRFCARAILSSEDAEIQEAARRYGIDVPFSRPRELATDEVSSDAVLRHALEWVSEHDPSRYDAAMLLEAASPFATSLDYDAAVALMTERGAKLVTGVTRHRPNRVFVGPLGADGSIASLVAGIEGMTRLDRQAQAPEYTLNGAFYLVDWSSFVRSGSRYAHASASYGLVMDPYHSVEIDEPPDLEWARYLVDRGLVDLGPWR